MAEAIIARRGGSSASSKYELVTKIYVNSVSFDVPAAKNNQFDISLVDYFITPDKFPTRLSNFKEDAIYVVHKLQDAAKEFLAAFESIEEESSFHINLNTTIRTYFNLAGEAFEYTVIQAIKRYPLQLQVDQIDLDETFIVNFYNNIICTFNISNFLKIFSKRHHHC